MTITALLETFLIIIIDLTFALIVFIVAVFILICEYLRKLLIFTNIKALVKTGDLIKKHIIKASMLELLGWGVAVDKFRATIISHYRR
jgi:hypothetical protein